MKKFNDFRKILHKVFAILLLTGWLVILIPNSLLVAKPLRFYKGWGGDFTLTGHDGANVNLEDYRGKVILLYFGYTFCPDACPTTLLDLKQIMKKLDKQAQQVQTLFISIDPERDTPERLKEFVTHFDPSFVGLTGSEKAIKKAAEKYGMRYMREQVESVAGYFFAHTDYVFLVDKQGRLRGRFQTQREAEQLVSGIQQLIIENK
ncbi:MAG: SCO family protein [SAR324 cluster bacterium]|nr:SCO family protein [SAR324 cluster bacterium]